jgi:hypothetical protein
LSDTVNILRPDGVLPRASADFQGPCLIEVERHHRQGRGRWWRANGCGYTDLLPWAGVYTADEARFRSLGTETCYPVDARAALAQIESAVEAFKVGVREWAGRLPPSTEAP